MENIQQMLDLGLEKKNTLNLVVCSLSTRKLWTVSRNKMYSPGFALLADFAVQLAKDYNVYVLHKTVEKTPDMFDYTNQKVDAVIIMGSDWTFVKAWECYKKLIAPQFEYIKEFNKKNIPVVMLSVDIDHCGEQLRKYADIRIDKHISEQDLLWQECGALYIKEALKDKPETEKYLFGFNGNAKKRYTVCRKIFEAFDKPFVLHGGGWNRIENPNAIKKGVVKFIPSAQEMSNCKYTICLHDKKGNAHNWLTSRYWENLALGILQFIHQDYDKSGMVVKTDDWRRFKTAEEMLEKIEYCEKHPEFYKQKIAEQNKELREEWFSFEYYYKPLKKELLKFLRGKK